MPSGLDPTVPHELLVVVDASNNEGTKDSLLILNSARVYGLQDDPSALEGIPSPNSGSNPHTDGGNGSSK